jgi:excisionase family DNA binding protein
MAQTIVSVGPEELAELVRKAVREELAHNPPKPTKNYLDTGEVAEHFGVSRATVLNWVSDDGCPHIKRGKLLRFELAAMEAWFRGRAPALTRVK